MATTSNTDGSLTIIVHLRIKPEHNARALELWHEQIADIQTTEPPGNVKYSVFRNNSAEHEYTVVQTFASKEIMEAWYKKPKHEEISSQVYGEGLIDGEPDPRYLTKIAGTSR